MPYAQHSFSLRKRSFARAGESLPTPPMRPTPCSNPACSSLSAERHMALDALLVLLVLLVIYLFYAVINPERF